MGCVFASKVTVPSESLQASNQGLEYAGYQAPVTMNNRDSYKKLSVSFIETNSSFLDFVIRPWVISVGYYGFVTRANNLKVKAKNLDVIYIAKAGSGVRPLKRKLIRFYGVAPVSIGSISNQYSSDSVQNINVDFVYDYYTVSAEDSNAQNYTNTINNQGRYTNSNSSNGEKYSNAALQLAFRGAPQFYYTPFSKTIAAQQAQSAQGLYGGSFFAVKNSSIVAR